jgi:hypothetical protein
MQHADTTRGYNTRMQVACFACEVVQYHVGCVQIIPGACAAGQLHRASISEGLFGCSLWVLGEKRSALSCLLYSMLGACK